MQITAGSTDQWVPVFARTSAGAELPSKVATDFALWYSRPGAADVSIPLTDLTALTDPHVDGKIKFVRGCQYRLAAPDLAFAAGVSDVTINGTVDGGLILPYPIVIDTTQTAAAAAIAAVNLDHFVGTATDIPALPAGTYLDQQLTAVEAIPTTKTGYSLAATGLDAITATEPAGKPTTFPGWIMWLVQRFRRSTKSATAIVVKTEAGATVTTQAITSSGDDQTLGPPT